MTASWLLGSILLLVCAASARLTGPTDNVVDDWMAQAQRGVQVSKALNVPAAKAYALMGFAMSEALKAGGAPPYALAAVAGHTAYTALFPDVRPVYPDLLDMQLNALDKDSKPRATEAERKAAQRIAVPIALSTLKAKDPNPAKLTTTMPLVLSMEEADAIAGNTDTSRGPVFKSPRNDYAETFKLGAKDSKARTAADTDTATFWSAGPGTSAITGFWLSIAREVLPPMSLEDTARFFARAGAAAYDANIVANKVKARDNQPRPQTIFQKGLNGWPASPGWVSLVFTPPDAEYPSGHSVTSGAVLEVLLTTMNGKDGSFKVCNGTSDAQGACRQYKTMADAAVAVGDSRVFGGVHFRSSTVDGLKLGRAVASKVVDRVKPGGSAATKAPAAAIAQEAGGKDIKTAGAGRHMLWARRRTA